MPFSSDKRPPTFDLLGGEISEVDSEAGTATVWWTLGDGFTNPLGTIQGGFLAAVMDDTAAIAYLAKKDEGWVIPSVEMKTSFLAPTFPGRVRAEGKVLKDGRTVAFLEARLYDESGALLSVASITGRPTPIERLRRKGG